MKQTYIALLFAMISCLTWPKSAKAEDVLTGEKRLACEATLCLTQNAGRPDECQESIKKYFAIKIKKAGSLDPKKTLEARKNFLKLCPKVDEEIIDSVNTIDDLEDGGLEDCGLIDDPFEKEQCEIEQCNLKKKDFGQCMIK